MNDDAHTESEPSKRIDGMHTLSGGRPRAVQHIGEQSTVPPTDLRDSAEYFALLASQLGCPGIRSILIQCLKTISFSGLATSRYSAPEFEVDLSSLPAMLDADILVHSKLTCKYTFRQAGLLLADARRKTANVHISGLRR
jgi:hypothetical protein